MNVTLSTDDTCNIFNAVIKSAPSLHLSKVIEYACSHGRRHVTAGIVKDVYVHFGGTNDRVSEQISAYAALYIVGTTILDDIVEGHDTRLDAPATHVTYGTGATIVAGTYLLHEAWNHLAPLAPKSTYRLNDVFGGWIEKDAVFGKDVADCKAALHKLGTIYDAFMSIAAECAFASKKDTDAVYEAGRAMGYAKEIIDELKDLSGDFKREPAAEHKSGEDILVVVRAREIGVFVDEQNVWVSLRGTKAHEWVMNECEQALAEGEAILKTKLNNAPPIQALIDRLRKEVENYSFGR